MTIVTFLMWAYIVGAAITLLLVTFSKDGAYKVELTRPWIMLKVVIQLFFAYELYKYVTP